MALAWFWGLGFFYAIHVTWTYGWTGFLAFAIPNAAGLALFGALLDRFMPKADLGEAFATLARGYGGSILAYQALAIAITVFGFASCLFMPLLGGLAIPAVAVVVLVGMACGHRIGLGGLRLLHTAYFVVGVAAVLGAWVYVPWRHADPVAAHAQSALDDRFFGLVIPTLLGFLLGPWLDVQHWHRAARIRREGGSLTVAYGAGSVLFFLLIGANAVITHGLPATAAAYLHTDFGGALDACSVLARALADAGPAASTATALFAVWAAVAMASTIDSAYSATRWFLASALAGSQSSLVALMPPKLLRTPLWTLLAGMAIAAGAMAANASVPDLMVPFTTLFVGFASCLVLQASGRHGSPDGLLSLLLGALSATLFGIGYYSGLPALTGLSPLVALLGALPLLVEPSTKRSSPLSVNRGTSHQATASAPDPVVQGVGPRSGMTSTAGFFDGAWFNFEFIPTYDDTNSVGNVYFVNYMRWVGKTRELFFMECMPNFDLKTTPFFILTRDFYHQYVREAREFEAVTIRIKLGKHNRKFVTLEHEIRTAAGNVLGKGHQQLMFVDSHSHRLVDIPAKVMSSFIPYLASNRDALATTSIAARNA